MRLLRAEANPLPSSLDPDDRLVRLSLDGDAGAFGVLYERYFSTLFGFAYRMLGDPAEAEDIAHDALTRAWSKLSLYQNGNFRSWLFAITHNMLRDHARIRSGLNSPTALPEMLPGNCSTENEAITIVAVRDLLDLLDQLVPHSRAVVCLKLSGLSYAEIADVVGRTPASVAQDYSRTIKRLALAMDRGEGRLASTGNGGATNV